MDEDGLKREMTFGKYKRISKDNQNNDTLYDIIKKVNIKENELVTIDSKKNKIKSRNDPFFNIQEEKNQIH